MTKKTTWTAAAIAGREIGYTIRRTGFGSERAVYKTGTERPMSHGATYFTDDAEDAVDTARKMHRQETLNWIRKNGAPERGSMAPIKTSVQRTLVLLWMRRVHGITKNAITMTSTQLAEIWHDTTDAKVNEIKHQKEA